MQRFFPYFLPAFLCFFVSSFFLSTSSFAENNCNEEGRTEFSYDIDYNECSKSVNDDLIIIISDGGNGEASCYENDYTTISSTHVPNDDLTACIESTPTTCSITKENNPTLTDGEFHHVLYGGFGSKIANSNEEISLEDKDLLINAINIEKEDSSWQKYTTINDDDGNNNNPSSLTDLDDEGTIYEINTTNPRYSLIKILDIDQNIVGYNVYENTCTIDPLEVLTDNITGICLNPDDYWEASDYPLPQGSCVQKTADLSVQADINSPHEVKIGAGEFSLPLKVENNGPHDAKNIEIKITFDNTKVEISNMHEPSGWSYQGLQGLLQKKRD